MHELLDILIGERQVCTAGVEHDWSAQDNDLITALSEEASVPVSRWNLVTLEPECTLLSIANAINQKKGSAHGKWSLTELNICATQRYVYKGKIFNEGSGEIPTGEGRDTHS